MKTAKFVNFTNEEFIGYWDGKAHKYPAGKSQYMPDYLAKHFAKHLTNRELLKTKEDGKTLIYTDGDIFTSPKKPEEVPVFMELFNKAYIPQEDEIVGDEKDNVSSLIDVQNKNIEEAEELGTSKETPTFPINKKPK